MPVPGRKSSLTNVLALAGILLTLTAVSLAEAEFKCHNKIDMVILLDISGSVTRKQFEIGKKFSADLVKHFHISKEKTNVAVASYSQYAYTARTFEEHASQKSVLRAINGLGYEGAASRSDYGLDLVKGMLSNTQYGSRASNKGVKKVAVVITDGFSTRGVEFTRDSAATLKRKGVELFSVGISKHFDKAELDELASKPRKTHQLMAQLERNYFTKEQVQHLAKQICKKRIETILD